MSVAQLSNRECSNMYKPQRLSHDGFLKAGKPHASHDAPTIPEVGSQCFFQWPRRPYTEYSSWQADSMLAQYLKPDAAADRNILQILQQ